MAHTFKVSQKKVEKVSAMENPAQMEMRPSSNSEMLHALSNKLLPIIVFSELGLRRCQDPQLSEHFRKILHSVREAQLLMDQFRLDGEELGPALSASNPSLAPKQNGSV